MMNRREEREAEERERRVRSALFQLIVVSDEGRRGEGGIWESGNL